MYIKDYVEATYSILHKTADTEVVLASLTTYLKKRGLFKLYPAILRGVVDKSTRKEKNSTSRIFVAREKDIDRHKTEIASHLPLDNTTETIIDPTLIGGFIIKTKDTYIDQSHKNKLLHAYHRVIN
jgi:F0F1-type ATP synthase delta subunit